MTIVIIIIIVIFIIDYYYYYYYVYCVAVVWNMKANSGTTWITLYWSRPQSAPYLTHVVEYVVTVKEAFTLSGKSLLLF